MSKAEKLSEQVKSGYNKIADHFSNTRYAPWSEFELFKQYIKEGQKILDSGCGNARLYQFFKRQNLPIEYYGFDNSENLITISKEKYPEIADRLAVSEMTKLPYEDNFFNIIISIATFHHLPTKSMRIKALREIMRVLQPGGYLLMTNWHLWHQPFLKHFFNKFSKKISLKDFIFPWKSADSKIQCQRYYHAFTKNELRRLLKKTNFKIEKIFTHKGHNKKSCGRGVNIVSICKK